MKKVYIRGMGAVSPAGWGLEAFRAVLAGGKSPHVEMLPRASQAGPHLRVRRVPKLPAVKPFLSHPRLRRASPITLFAAGAAEEALGKDIRLIQDGQLKLGIIFCVLSGCVNYSRRFYAETLSDPATASPLIFPETVFNAPASHLGAFLRTDAINYTLVGDQGTFLQGLALAAQWFVRETVDGCLVVGSEEIDWITSAAAAVFSRSSILSEGAGALYLSPRAGGDRPIVLRAVTEAISYSSRIKREQAARTVRREIERMQRREPVLLCESRQGIPRLDRAEEEAWNGWPGQRLSLKPILGEAFNAGAAWQCLAAVDALRRDGFSEAVVNVAGTNQQTIAALFALDDGGPGSG